MGKAYKSQKSVFVDDKMYKAPWELMAKVLEKKDKEIDDSTKELDILEETLGKQENLTPDNQVLSNAISKYREEMNGIADTINGDLPNYNDYIHKIHSLKRKMSEDLNSGQLSKMTGNVKQRSEIFAGFDKNKKVNPTRIQAGKDYLDNLYRDRGGLGYKNSNVYNKYQEEGNNLSLMEDVNTDKFLNDLKVHFTPDQTATASAGAGGDGYTYTSRTTKKELKPIEVEDYINNWFTTSNYIPERTQLHQMELYNQGYKGGDLKYLTEAAVEEDKKALVERGRNQLGFTSETKAKAVGNDSLSLMKLKKAWKTEESLEDSMNVVDERIDRRDVTGMKSNFMFLDEMRNTDAAKKYGDFSTEDNVFETLKRLKKEGKASQYGKFIKEVAAEMGESSGDVWRKLNTYTNSLKDVGYTGSLIDLPKNATPSQELQYAKEVKAVSKALDNHSFFEDAKIAIQDGSNNGYTYLQASPLELYNSGKLSGVYLGNKTVTNKVEVVAPPNSSNLYEDKSGNSITFPQGVKEYNGHSIKDVLPTKEEAMQIAKDSGRELKTTSIKNSISVLNSKPGFKSFKKRKFTAKYPNAQGEYEQYYEIEVPLLIDGEYKIGVIRKPIDKFIVK